MSTSEQPSFEVRLRSKRVQRELDGLQGIDYERVVVKLGALATAPRPRGCEKLYDAIYRVRSGDFRTVYLIDEKDKRIEVGGIRRRTERTYKGIEGLFR
jgi:mRNA-degrading endonuclease RelE of RelBE toxin-antitoxin system